MFDKLKKELLKEKFQDRITISDKFWIEDLVLHEIEYTRTCGNCCFNHQIGLPKRKVEPYSEMPIFDYELEIIKNIELHKDYALNKARGIGATEIILRWILFQAFHNDIPARKFLIITGIRGELAREYIRRIANLCSKFYQISKTSDKIIIGKSEIIAMPAEPSAIRGYENVQVIFADEAAHWNLQDDDPVLEAIEPHRTKSDARIIIVSTPNGRRGFFGKIFSNSFSRYHKDTMPWTVSEGKLIDRKEVEKIRKEDPYRYEQEYNCKFITTRYAVIPPEAMEKLRNSGVGYALD